jgi:hypothetical protein
VVSNVLAQTILVVVGLRCVDVPVTRTVHHQERQGRDVHDRGPGRRQVELPEHLLDVERLGVSSSRTADPYSIAVPAGGRPPRQPLFGPGSQSLTGRLERLPVMPLSQRDVYDLSRLHQGHLLGSPLARLVGQTA